MDRKIKIMGFHMPTWSRRMLWKYDSCNFIEKIYYKIDYLKYFTNLKNCLIHFYPKFNQHFQFINCTMANLEDDLIDVAKSCSLKYSIPFDKLNLCANSSLGNQLLHGSGILTESLKPKLTYVPWIIIDNKYTDVNQDKAETDLIQFICKNSKVIIRLKSFLLLNILKINSIYKTNKKAPFIDTIPICKKYVSKRRDFESLRNSLIDNRNKFINNRINNDVNSLSNSYYKTFEFSFLKFLLFNSVYYAYSVSII